MITTEEIIDKLKTVYSKYDNIKVGLAGSFANGTAKTKSDIDIVLDGDSMRMEIAEYIRSLFNNTVDILWLDLLKADDEEMDNFSISIGLGTNEYSVYKTIKREVIWI